MSLLDSFVVGYWGRLDGISRKWGLALYIGHFTVTAYIRRLEVQQNA
jgi:hypothetical protein